MIYQYHVDVLLILLAIGAIIGVPIAIMAGWSERDRILTLCEWIVARICIWRTQLYVAMRAEKKQNEREIRLNPNYTKEGFVLARTRSHSNEALHAIVCQIVRAASIHPSADIFDRYAVSVHTWDQTSKDAKYVANQLYYIEGGSLQSLLLTLTGEKVYWKDGCCVTVIGFVVCRDIV